MTLIRSTVPHAKTDAIVVGAGLAGMVAALALYPLRVLLVTPQDVGRGGSSEYAKGGIAASVTAGDSTQRHTADTVFAGAGLTVSSAAEAITLEGAESITWLEENGVVFDRTQAGDLELGQEGAHSAPRIVHSHGDQTGRFMTQALANKVRQSDHIKVIDGATVESLYRTHHGAVCGVSIHTNQGRQTFRGKNVILCTGGIGGLFQYTTNPITSTGRGLALAARAGAKLTDLEFVQFHPTALHVACDPLPLMTEALRGAGAKLVDTSGRGFMDDISPLGDLAPRDIVSRTLWQRQVGGEENYLDGRHLSKNIWSMNFPAALRECQAAQLDPTKDLIPITPAVHYHMGGIDTDLSGKTSVSGLWALGECACTGLHGANRLASNSLLEAVVVARKCAEKIKGEVDQTQRHESISNSPKATSHIPDNRIMPWLRQEMWHAMGLERSAETMTSTLEKLAEVSQTSDSLTQTQADALLTARLMIRAALARCESRGGHRRNDYPGSDPNYIARLSMTLNEDHQTSELIWQPLPQEQPSRKKAVA